MFGIDAAIINSKIICKLKEKRIYSTFLFKEKIIETIFEIYKKYNSNQIILYLIIIRTIFQKNLD